MAEHSKLKWLPLITAGFIGFAVTLLTTQQINQREFKDVDARFQLASLNAKLLIQNSFNNSHGTVKDVVAWMDSVPQITASNFHSFTQQILANAPTMDFFAWFDATDIQESSGQIQAQFLSRRENSLIPEGWQIESIYACFDLIKRSLHDQQSFSCSDFMRLEEGQFSGQIIIGHPLVITDAETGETRVAGVLVGGKNLLSMLIQFMRYITNLGVESVFYADKIAGKSSIVFVAPNRELINQKIPIQSIIKRIWNSPRVIEEHFDVAGNIYYTRINPYAERYDYVWPALSWLSLVFGSLLSLSIVVVMYIQLKRSEKLESLNDILTDQVSETQVELSQAHHQLIQSEKLAAIGQLAAGVAHEINNPMAFINSNLNTMSDYVKSLLEAIPSYEAMLSSSDEQQQKLKALREEHDLKYVEEDFPSLLDETREGVSRVKRIVADLKDYSRVDNSEFEKADIHACLDSTINVAANELRYKADVVKEYGDIPLINCFPHQLNQVFMNLLVNAAQAMDEHGKITIRTQVEEDQWLLIQVSDNGRGVDPENIQKLFEPFFTTKPVGEGTGLGLSLSYSIIQNHLGDLSVDSELGKGTCFTIKLPLELTEDQLQMKSKNS